MKNIGQFYFFIFRKEYQSKNYVYNITIVDLIKHQIVLTTEIQDLTVFSNIDNCTLFCKNYHNLV